MGQEPPRERDLNQPLVVASSDSFFPYQFRERDGQLTGFAVDITNAAARIMNLRLQRVPIAVTDMDAALRSGRVDFIQFWSETDTRRAWADFSVPIVGGIETIAVVRKDDGRLRKLSDLDGKRVAVGQKGTVGWNYVAAVHPHATPVFTENSEQFLRLLAAGEIDAAVMSRLTAASMIDRFGLTNLKILEDRIPGSRYDVRYCFTVRKGDSQLLARLNEGLAILHRTGEYDRIYHQWFGRYEARTFSPIQVVSYVAAALGLGCIAAVWGLVRQWQLSRRVAKQAAELAEQRSLLAALHDRHPLATVIFETADHRPAMIVSANGEAERLFDVDASSLPRPLAAVRMAAEFREYFDEAVRRPGDARAAWEARVGSPPRLLETALVPLGETAAGMRRLCILSNDVTRRRAMDQEIAQSRRLRALGELVGGIAHEFNNLLTPIMLTTSQARFDPALPAEAQKGYQVIDNAARRAAELTRRLLTFGRKADERAERVQTAQVIESCFALLQPTVDRRIQWSSYHSPDLPPLMFNATDLSQVVFNLVINARDTLVEKLARPYEAGWTPRLHVEVGELLGSAHQPRKLQPAQPIAWQRITIEDNGCGIAPENVDRIFEPFFTTKEVGQGTGLGLATVWHLVTEAGGDIVVESKLGVGTKIHVMLPRWEVAQPMERAAASPAAVPTRATAGRVLLVEDEPLVARATMAVLENAGYAVCHHTDGLAAWQDFSGQKTTYDLLLTDVNLPRMNGVDFVRQVRETKFGGRIVVMSGRVSEEERRTWGDLGVDLVLAKPFAAAELLTALEAVTQRAPARQAG